MDIPENRRHKIKKILFEKKSMSIKNLSNLLKISEITIRRDLIKLEDEGFIEKVHGGAMLKNHDAIYDPEYLRDLKQNSQQKESIAKEAVKRIKDGDGIIIETGTTCLQLVYNIENKRNLTIFTTSIPIANELWKTTMHRNDISVNLSGGYIEPKSGSLIGSQALNYFRNINADIAFLSGPAVLINRGVIASNSHPDAEIMTLIINSSKRNILLADSSKFKKTALISVLPLTVFEEIITDSGVENDTVEKIRKLGIKLTLV
ncbi:MAG: DeoR/GlpR transcriptional regulator [Actinobacteria bacterium]|nr:DeoR/GlpR transcriptional regulator [Actinomycetota bacterium]